MSKGCPAGGSQLRLGINSRTQVRQRQWMDSTRKVQRQATGWSQRRAAGVQQWIDSTDQHQPHESLREDKQPWIDSTSRHGPAQADSPKGQRTMTGPQSDQKWVPGGQNQTRDKKDRSSMLNGLTTAEEIKAYFMRRAQERDQRMNGQQAKIGDRQEDGGCHVVLLCVLRMRCQANETSLICSNMLCYFQAAWSINCFRQGVRSFTNKQYN